MPAIHAKLVLDCGGRVRIHAVHPSPPGPSWTRAPKNGTQAPLYARLRYSRAAQALHEEPAADEADQRDASERIGKTDVQQEV